MVRFGFITYGLDRPAFGIGRVTQSQGQALERHSAADPVFLTTYCRGPFVDARRMHYRLLGSRLAPGLMTCGALQLPVAAVKTRLELIHDPAGIGPFLLGRRWGSFARVVTLHDATPLRFPTTHTLLSRFLFRVYIPATLRNTDAVLTLSEDAKNDLTRFLHLPSTKVHVVSPGVDHQFAPAPAEVTAKTRSRFYGGEPFVLYVGALEPRKNLPTLLEAFAELRREFPRLHLVVAGGRRWKSSGLGPMVERLRLQDRVHFIGYVAERELPALYRAASVFCFPSLAEGFGLPVLEAMACGTPVVCSGVSSLPEVAGDAVVFVDPTQPESIAYALRRVLTEPDLAAQMRQRGLERAALFTWERTAARTVEVYQQVLGLDEGACGS
jgi:glycosyltransferase involved in cell wall biosynthesis